MTPHTLNKFRAKYPATIAAMDDDFDSHEFIQKLTQQNQQLYIDALNDHYGDIHNSMPSPFQSVHAILADLLNQFPTQVTRISHHPSKNIFGNDTDCATWRK